jgi:PQQ-like domain
VTVDERPVDPAADPAVVQYRAEMRRARGVYYAILAAVAVAVMVVVGIAWSHGEITHTHIRTAATPAPSITPALPAASVALAWRTTDHTATGTPFWGGTVITYDEHTVRGRNASTGAVTWSYTRTDRTVCAALQTYGLTVAIFQVNGNCDEVTTVDSQTGVRKWTRTLDEVGQPIDGRPAFSVSQYTIMATTPSVIYAFDPISGIDRFVFGQQHCTIHSAVQGSAGVLISQTCAVHDCSGLTFCGQGPQLLLRDGQNSRNDSDSKNPDRIIWNRIGNSDVPASADQLVSALDPAAGRLQRFDATKGKPASVIPVQSSVGTTSIDRLSTARAELVQIGRVAYAIDDSGFALIWQADAALLPTVTAPPGDTGVVADLSTATVAVATAQGVNLLDGATGRIARTVAITSVPAGSTAYPLGTGFVLSGPTTEGYR